MTGAVRATSPAVPGLTTFATDPRAPIVAAVGYNQLDFWNMSTRRFTVVRPARGDVFGQPSGMAYSPDGRRLVIAFVSNGAGPGLDHVRRRQREIVGSRPTSVSGVAYSPGGQELAVGEVLPAGGSIVTLSAASLRAKPGFRAVQDPDVGPTAVAFSPDGSRLAYGFADGTAGLVSAATGQPIGHLLRGQCRDHGGELPARRPARRHRLRRTGPSGPGARGIWR